MMNLYRYEVSWHSEFGHLISGDMINSITIRVINEKSYKAESKQCSLMDNRGVDKKGHTRRK